MILDFNRSRSVDMGSPHFPLSLSLSFLKKLSFVVKRFSLLYVSYGDVIHWVSLS